MLHFPGAEQDYPTWRLLECATSDFKVDAYPILDRHSIESTFCTPSNPPLSMTSVPACPNHKLNKSEAMGMCYFWSNDYYLTFPCTSCNPPFAQLKLHQERKGNNWQVQATTIGDIIGHAPCSSVIVYGRSMDFSMHAPMEALRVCYFLNYLSVPNLAHLTILPLLCWNFMILDKAPSCQLQATLKWETL